MLPLVWGPLLFFSTRCTSLATTTAEPPHSKYKKPYSSLEQSLGKVHHMYWIGQCCRLTYFLTTSYYIMCRSEPVSHWSRLTLQWVYYPYSITKFCNGGSDCGMILVEDVHVTTWLIRCDTDRAWMLDGKTIFISYVDTLFLVTTGLFLKP